MLPSIHTCISIRADYIQNAIKYTHAAILDTYILACTQRLTHVHAYIYTSMDETIHTYVHTYRPTYVHTHMHTHIRTYVRTYVQTRTRTHAHTHTLSLSLSLSHTYIYIYIYVYTYIYICIHMRTYKHTYKDTSVRTYTRTHEYAYIRTCKITNTHMHTCLDILHDATNMTSHKKNICMHTDPHLQLNFLQCLEMSSTSANISSISAFIAPGVKKTLTQPVQSHYAGHVLNLLVLQIDFLYGSSYASAYVRRCLAQQLSISSTNHKYRPR